MTDIKKSRVQFLRDTATMMANYQVHSMNTVGKKNIEDYIESARKHGAIV